MRSPATPVFNEHRSAVGAFRRLRRELQLAEPTCGLADFKGWRGNRDGARDGSLATEEGSSGSPVFNHDWQLVGLHHAGGQAVPKLNGKPGTYAANEGIFIQAIRDAVRLALA